MAINERDILLRLQRIEDRLFMNQIDNDYRVDVLGMKRAWQESQDENVNSVHAVTLDLYIPTDTKVIQRARLRIRLQRFRSNYGQTGGMIDIGGGDHIHSILEDIGISTLASDVTVGINGIDRTAALGGPFNSDQDDLDITQYLTATGWNTIDIGSATLGRIHATVFVEIYLP